MLRCRVALIRPRVYAIYIYRYTIPYIDLALFYMLLITFIVTYKADVDLFICIYMCHVPLQAIVSYLPKLNTRLVVYTVL